MKMSTPKTFALAGCLGLATSLTGAASSSAQLAPECPLTSDESSFTDSGLDAFTPERNGTIYDTSGSHLRLQKAGGNFASTSSAVSDAMMAVCAGDFDEDGWDDLFAYDASRRFRYHKNQTYENPAPNWNDVNDVRVGKFVPKPIIIDYSGNDGGSSWISCGDYNGDGHVDAVAAWSSGNNVTPGEARMFLGSGNGTFTTGHNFLGSLSQFDDISWNENMVSTDYNGDGRVDLIVGLADN